MPYFEIYLVVTSMSMHCMISQIIEERTNMLLAHFLFSVVWSIGGTLDGPSRLKFDEFFRGVCDGEGSHAKYPR